MYECLLVPSEKKCYLAVASCNLLSGDCLINYVTTEDRRYLYALFDMRKKGYLYMETCSAHQLKADISHPSK